MQATIAWLRDDTAGYEAARAEGVRDRSGVRASSIASSRASAVREHRYVEAIELEKEAIKLKPDFYEAMAGAGLGYLRLGMEKEGLDWLDKSFHGDGYNVRAFNTLNLFDRLPQRVHVRDDEETSRSATTTRRRRRSPATSSRRWSARSPTW